MSTGPVRILKSLTPNDVGDTGSHQAGWAIPKGVVDFFPALDPREYNPDTWIEVVGPSGQVWSWRYIYYNSRLHNAGTRNEYRLTHVRDAMRDLGAARGDLIEFSRDGESIRVRILSEPVFRNERGKDVIEITGSSRWFVASVPAR